MLKTIRLKNYRSHRDTVVELDPHVNVIVGRGQAGKTNIMRGFETMRLNRPMGFKYHSWFSKGATEIVVETTEGYVVTFTKDKKDGVVYTVQWPETKLAHRVEEYRKVGTKVPDQVTAALNMTDLNMQWQHDSPYLVTGSTAQIGKAINAVIDFEELDKWISEINSKRTKVKMEIKSVTGQLNLARDELAQLSRVSEVGDLIAEAEQLDGRIARKRTRCHDIEGFVTRIIGMQRVIHEHGKKIKAKEPIDAATVLQATIDAKCEKYDLLSKAVGAHKILQTSLRAKAMAKGAYLNIIKNLGMCPTCYTPIDADTIARIKEEL